MAFDQLKNQAILLVANLTLVFAEQVTLEAQISYDQHCLPVVSKLFFLNKSTL